MNSTYLGESTAFTDLEHFELIVFTQSKLVEFDDARQTRNLRLVMQLKYNYKIRFANILFTHRPKSAWPD